MPTLVEIVTNLVSTMRAVPSAGAVHPRVRSARTAEQLARLCAFEGSYRGWALEYLGSTEVVGKKIGTVERTLRFRLRWVLPYDDDRTDGETSTDEFIGMFEDMAVQLRTHRELGFCGGNVRHNFLQIEGEPVPTELSQAKGTAHVGRSRIDVIAIVIAKACPPPEEP